MNLQFELGPNFHRALTELPAMARGIKKAVRQGLSAGVKLAAARAASDHLSGQDLKRRTGALARAVDGWLAGDLEGVVGVRENSAVEKYKYLLGSESKTIVPKSAKFLAIPMADGLTPSGVARYASPRDVPDGFFFTGKSGGLFFGKHRGKTKKSKLLVLFTFKKSVTVTGTGALAAAVMASLDDITDQISARLENLS